MIRVGGAFLIVLALTVPATAGAAAAPTRDQYIAAVEPICKARTLANTGVLEGVEGMVRGGELGTAADRVQRGANALEATVRQLARVSRPASDAERLGRWLGYAKTGGGLLRKLVRELDRGHRNAVQGVANQLLLEARRANAVVVGFDFDYCRVSPARFV